MLRQRRLVGGPEPKRTSRFLRYYCFRLSNFTFCDRGSSPEERGAAGGKGPAPARRSCLRHRLAANSGHMVVLDATPHFGGASGRRPTPRWASSLLEMTGSGHGRCLAVLLHILVLVTAVLRPGIDVIGKGRINAGKAE